MVPLGAHVSTAGGVSTAFARAAAISCDALQIFVKNANTWRAAALGAREIAAFAAAHAATAGAQVAAPLPIVAHAGYLINLCSPRSDVHERSRAAAIDELERCAALGIPGLVLHPGAHLGAGGEAGVEGVARSLDAIHAATPAGVRVLLENTAGQGTLLGSRLAELAAIRRHLDAPDRIGFCLDTCHAYAAGYDIADADGYLAFMAEVERELGLASVAVVHCNDSAFGLGSRKDRHANVGAGALGPATFARWLSDPRWDGVPHLLETPLGDDGLGHARDLATLRAL
jgi:deoxyribonuclease IV